MKVEFSPATIPDLADFAGGATHVGWAIRKEMWRSGQVSALRVDDALVALGGLYPCDDGAAEFWLDARPAAGRHIFAMVAHFKLTAVASGYREIVALCRSRAGVVIARRSGMRLRETCELGEIWTWKPCSAAATPKSS